MSAEDLHSVVDSSIVAPDQSKLKSSSVGKLRKSNPNQSLNKSSLFLTANNKTIDHQVHLVRESAKYQGSVTNMDDYFDSMFKKQDLSLKAGYEADQIIKNSTQDTKEELLRGEIKIAPVSLEVEDTLVEFETENVKSLQDKVIRTEMAEHEKVRKKTALKLVDLEQDYYKLRVDQVAEKQVLDKLRKELTRQLLQTEDQINKLRIQLSTERKNHHFSSNANLHNSLMDLSIISVQRDYVSTWENDPESKKRREEFVERQMKEWQENYDKREQKVKDMEKEIKMYAEQIQKLKLQQQTETNGKKQKRIAKFLEELEKNQDVRIKEHHRTNNIVRKLLDTKTMAEKSAIQDAKFIEEQLQQRKKKLEQIAEFYKPIDLDAINEHDKKFLDIHQEKLDKREKKCMDRAQTWNKFKAQYYGEGYKKAQDDVKIMRNPKEEEHKKAQDKLERQKEMEKKIKEKFMPKIDERKMEEMEELVHKVKYQSDFTSYKNISDKVKSKRITVGIPEKLLKKIEKNNRRIEVKPFEDTPEEKSPRTLGNHYLKKFPILKKEYRSVSPDTNDRNQIHQSGLKLPPIAKTSSDAQFKRDYLKEIREKQILPKRDILHDWESIAYKQKYADETIKEESTERAQQDKKQKKKQKAISRLKSDSQSNKPDVKEQLFQEAKHLEKIAKQRHELLRVRNVSDNKLIEDEDEVDDLYVNAIKARLLGMDKDAHIDIPKPKPKQKKILDVSEIQKSLDQDKRKMLDKSQESIQQQRVIKSPSGKDKDDSQKKNSDPKLAEKLGQSNDKSQDKDKAANDKNKEKKDQVDSNNKDKDKNNKDKDPPKEVPKDQQQPKEAPKDKEPPKDPAKEPSDEEYEEVSEYEEEDEVPK